MVDVGNVVDFAEWQQKNYSANAARYMSQLLPLNTRATRGEMLHLYVHHLSTGDCTVTSENPRFGLGPWTNADLSKTVRESVDG